MIDNNVVEYSCGLKDNHTHARACAHARERVHLYIHMFSVFAASVSQFPTA